MDNRYRSSRYERERRYDNDYNRYDDDYGRQPEQFQDGEYRQYGDDRRYGMNNQYSNDRYDNDRNYRSSQGNFQQGRYNPLDDYDQDSRYSDDDYSRRDYADSSYRANRNRSHSYMRGDEMGGPAMTGPYVSGYGTASGSRYSSGGYGGSYYDRDYDNRGYGSSRHRDNRGFFDRVTDWFSDDDDDRYRDRSHRGRGPKNYKRSNERLLEDACERLTHDHRVNASEINVTAKDNEITLDGTVGSRREKRRAEDCVHDISGVTHVQNNLRVDNDWNDDYNDSRGTRSGRYSDADETRSVRKDPDATNRATGKKATS